jgi:acyl-CoA synthetase (AMP-forming)/AMP-acid ligase II
MVIGLLAIAKAGGAYLPMDPAYPTERLAFMLADSGVGVLLTQRHLCARLPEPETEVKLVLLDESRSSTDHSAPASGVGPADIAYVIYTSGSTGKPKGVVLDHRGRVNNFLDFNRRFGVGTGDALIALASLSFDMCAYDVFGTLAAGATLVMPRQDELQDARAWARLMQKERVTIWHTAPAMLRMLVDHCESDPSLAPRRCASRCSAATGSRSRCPSGCARSCPRPRSSAWAARPSARWTRRSSRSTRSIPPGAASPTASRWRTSAPTCSTRTSSPCRCSSPASSTSAGSASARATSAGPT